MSTKIVDYRKQKKKARYFCKKLTFVGHNKDLQKRCSVYIQRHRNHPAAFGRTPNYLYACRVSRISLSRENQNTLTI